MKQTIHQSVYFWGTLLLLISLPFSRFTLSLAQFILMINWLVEGDLKGKWKRFLQHKTALLFVSVFLLHLIGFLYSNNILEALKDLRIKLPLLLLPLLYSTIPAFSEQQLKRLLNFFIAAVLGSSLYSFYIYLGFTQNEITDVRDIVPLGSHIRLSLMICLSLFVLLIRLKKNIGPVKPLIRWGMVVLMGWFVFFLYILESATGFGILLLVLPVLFTLPQLFQHKGYRFIAVLSLVLPVGLILWQVADYYQEKKSASDIRKAFTIQGAPYQHYPGRDQIENSSYVWRNIAENELAAAWEKRSKLSYQGEDNKGQNLSNTLIRFLASKGLNKDEEGLMQLSDQEIQAVENGISNYRYIKGGMQVRLHQIIWEVDMYINGGNPTGHSVTPRFEFWKAAFYVIQQHPFTGVGNGDIKEAMQQAYIANRTALSSENRLLPHNQYLRFGVMFGLFGAGWFVFSLLYPLYRYRTNMYYLAFMLIAIFSMMAEDTIETQFGVSFFAVFNSLLLCVRKDK